MKKLIFLCILMTLCSCAYANLSLKQVPVSTGVGAATVQDGSITDTGTKASPGNVGIGSTIPAATLDVNGTVRGTGFYGDGSHLTGIASASGWILSGSNVTLITPSNNVGIGSITPGQALDVTGTVRATVFSGAGTGLTGTGSSFTAGNVTTNANLTGAVISVGNATSNNFTANIGIGSASPSQALDVNGTVKATALIATGTGASTTQGNLGVGVATPINNLDVTGNAALGSYGGVDTAPSNGLAVSGNVGIGTWVPTGLFEASGSTENVYIGATGNVGIGTSIPANLLDVQGTLQHVYVSTSGNLGVGQTNPARALDVTGDINATTGYRFNGVQMMSVSGGNQVVIGPSSSTTSTVFNTSGATQMELNGSNVGIGSLNPAQRLDVVGTVRGTQLDVEGTILLIHNTTGGGCTQITANSSNTISGASVACQ